MTGLTIAVVEAHPAALTAAPAVTFRMRIETPAEGPVHAVALRCQTRIEPRGRRYTAEEEARLYELFGDRSQWHRTLQAVTWASTSTLVPSFDRQIEVDVQVPCTYDLHVAASKYFHAVRSGDVPLVFLFGGTIFTTRGAALQIEPVAWDVEARFRMPAQVWQAAMDRFFPGGGWIRLQRDTIDRLQAFRGRHAVLTWDEALDLLLRHAAVEERESAARARAGAAVEPGTS